MSADIIITVCILFGLSRSKTGWSHTDTVSDLTHSTWNWLIRRQTITRLIRMTLEAQVPPTMLAIAFITEYRELSPLHATSSILRLARAVVTPSSLLGGFLEGVQAKVYAVGLMYALNVRVTLQQRYVDNDGTKVSSISSQNISLQVPVPPMLWLTPRPRVKSLPCPTDPLKRPSCRSMSRPRPMSRWVHQLDRGCKSVDDRSATMASTMPPRESTE